MKYNDFYQHEDNFLRAKALYDIADKINLQSQRYMQFVAAPPMGASPMTIHNCSTVASDNNKLAKRISINALMEELIELRKYVAKPEVKFDPELYREMLNRKLYIENFMAKSQIQPL